MDRPKSVSMDTITYALALSARLEGEGQLNIAKLLRAAAASAINQAAFKLELPGDKSQLTGEIMRLIGALSIDDADKALISTLQRAASVMAEGRLPMIDIVPNPSVCRTCGHLLLEKAGTECPICHAHPSTFQAFLPVYWLEAFNPFEALEHLSQTPVTLSGYLEGKSETVLYQQPQDGGWSIYQILVHLRDAQVLLNFRVGLMLEQENPSLQSQAVFEWADRQEANQPKPEDVFESYLLSRRQTLASLESISLKDWWRKGLHEEFGEVTILQQASYFASHELTHLPQLSRLLA